MPDSEINGFGRTAKSLSGSPLGIIALFIVLIYGFAALTLGISAKNLSAGLQIPLVWFLVLFPVVVLGVFAYLVINQHQKLYGPSDFTDQALFIQLQQELREFKSVAKPVIDRQIEHETTDEPINFSAHKLQLDEGEERILKILAGGEYTFRTTRGLAKEAELPTEKAKEYIDNLLVRNLVGQKELKNGPRWYIRREGNEVIAAEESAL
jgi:hypothetical protein